MDHEPMTLDRHIMVTQKDYPLATGEFSGLLSGMALAAKVIAREVNKAGLAEILGLTGGKNIQGEEVQKLDEFADDTITAIMGRSGHICVMASEERADPIPIPRDATAGKYVILFDPLDGSSNIDANVSIGTIFSIYRRKSEGRIGDEDDLVRKGVEQVAAGYVIYGSSTMFVYTVGRGVHGFTLDPSLGEFLLSHPDIRTPSRGKIYSVNEGNFQFWQEGTQKYIEYLKVPDKETGRPYSSRYIGSLVADFHRNLLYGGIFLYPADTKNPKKPYGKLRLLYEANPLAFIAENAGGAASDGEQRVMEVEAIDLHQRVPLIIGSKEDVAEADEFIQGKR